jgi:hypothetical protein
MKKILFGSAAAVCAAVGFSSFRTANTAGPFLFKVNTGVDIAKGIAGTTIQPSQVTFVNSIVDASCGTAAGFDCVVTFVTSALTSGHEHLSGSTPVTIRRTVATRASN